MQRVITTAAPRQIHHQPYLRELTTLFSGLRSSKERDSLRLSSDTDIILPSMVARSRASSVMMEGKVNDDNGGRMFFAPVLSDMGRRKAVSRK